MGNVRLSYTDINGDGTIDVSSNPLTNEIVEESNYYPFGLKHKGYNNAQNTGIGNDVAQKFKYNGIEFNESLGLNLYEMDVRMYDPAIARFNGMDPVTHFSQGTSVAFDNNPIFWADPSGADSRTIAGPNGSSWTVERDENGEWVNPTRVDSNTDNSDSEPNEEDCCGWQSFLAGKLASFLTTGEPVTNETVINYLSGIRNSSNQGYNDAIASIVHYLNGQIISGEFYFNMASGFFNDIANGESFFFNASPEYLFDTGQTIATMSASDWAYAISNQIPVSALTYGAGGITSGGLKLLSGVKKPKFKFKNPLSTVPEENVFVGLMNRHGKERFIFRGPDGRFKTGTGTPTTVSSYEKYLGFDSFGRVSRNTPINYSVIGGSRWVKIGGATGLAGAVLYGRTKKK